MVVVPLTQFKGGSLGPGVRFMMVTPLMWEEGEGRHAVEGADTA